MEHFHFRTVIFYAVTNSTTRGPLKPCCSHPDCQVTFCVHTEVIVVDVQQLELRLPSPVSEVNVCKSCWLNIHADS